MFELWIIFSMRFYIRLPFGLTPFSWSWSNPALMPLESGLLGDFSLIFPCLSLSNDCDTAPFRETAFASQRERVLLFCFCLVEKKFGGNRTIREVDMFFFPLKKVPTWMTGYQIIRAIGRNAWLPKSPSFE